MCIHKCICICVRVCLYIHILKRERERESYAEHIPGHTCLLIKTSACLMKVRVADPDRLRHPWAVRAFSFLVARDSLLCAFVCVCMCECVARRHCPVLFATHRLFAPGQAHAPVIASRLCFALSSPPGFRGHRVFCPLKYPRIQCLSQGKPMAQ